MKRFFIIFLAFVLLLSGCKKEEKIPSFPVESMGMTFNSRPQKVLCLNPAAEEAVKVLGYGHSLIDNDEAFKDKNYPEKEEVLSLSPDFVIVSPDTRKSVKDALSEKGINTVEMKRFSDESELLEFLKGLTLIFEGVNDAPFKNEQLEFYFTETGRLLEEEGKRICEENFENPPTFLYVLEDNFALPKNSMESRFLEKIGFVNLSTQDESYYIPFSEIGSKPDILIYPDTMTNLPSRLNSYLDISYKEERNLYQSPSLFSMREYILESLFADEIVLEDNFLPLPPPPEEEEK